MANLSTNIGRLKLKNPLILGGGPLKWNRGPHQEVRGRGVWRHRHENDDLLLLFAEISKATLPAEGLHEERGGRALLCAQGLYVDAQGAQFLFSTRCVCSDH